MNWIQTFTGRKVDPLSIRPDDVCVEDIAHALAMKCRYTGHCPQFYSVAQHSVLVSRYCKSKLWGLLHDAAEAYLFDAARPVKIGFREKYGSALDEIEDSIMAAVCQKFGLPVDMPADVKAADVLLLTTEAKAFFGGTPLYKEWENRPENGYAIIEELAAGFTCWGWRHYESEFLNVFRVLS